MQQVELIRWIDACSPAHGGWSTSDDVDELLEPQIFESVGVVVREDDQILVLASTMDSAHPPTADMGGLTAIPKGCIIKRFPMVQTKESGS